MPPLIDLTEQTFGRLTVVERAENAKGRHPRWKCQCECGNIAIIDSASLKGGITKSCGCLLKEILSKTKFVHGMCKSPEYKTWECMKERCYNITNTAYKDYGGRGIKILPKWKNNFMAFFNYIGPKPSKKHSIDRIDNNAGYFPGNVKWSTQREQTNNTRRSHFIVINEWKLTIAQWARFVGINPLTLCTRIHRGWPVVKAVFYPVKHPTSSHSSKA